VHSVQVYHLFFQLSFYIFIFNKISFISLIFHLFFSYFNLFVSIFIQSYVNSNLQVSIIYILIIHKARNSETFKFVHLLASVTSNAPYSHYIIQTIGHVSIPKRHFFSPLCLFCAYDSSVLHNFKIFNHLLPNFSYSTLPLTEVESCVECNYFNDRARKVRKKFPWRLLKQIFYSCYSIIFLTLLSSLYRYYHLFVVTIIVHSHYYCPRCFFNVDFLSIKAVC